MVEIINGLTTKEAINSRLKNFFATHGYEGILYTSYPILPSGVKRIIIDALWLSKKYGIIAFDLIQTEEEASNYEKRQQEIFDALDSKLRQYSEFKKGKKEFLLTIDVISFAPGLRVSPQQNSEYKIIKSEEDLEKYINSLAKWSNSHLFDKVHSAIQSMITLKKKIEERKVTKKFSRADKLNNLEKNIAVLDRFQEKAIIEYYGGIQRIRGLAGSGKTIVLALKAAYLHAQNTDWNIAITFYTRSLKQQFKELISKFFFEKTGEEPDWKKLKIINAWGSYNDPLDERGLYYDFCLTHGIEFLNFRDAKRKNYNSPFDFACQHAMEQIEKNKISLIPKYDVILVDEAQDSSKSYLQLCYNFLRGDRKNLIYAYDELQQLNEGSSLPNPKEFLKIEDFDDRILKVCYRNPRPILVTAHALGFGIYRTNNKGERELVQFFDQPELWNDVGYSIESGELKAGSEVVLVREKNTSPEYLENHSSIEDLIVFKRFDDQETQADWIANEINKNLHDDELTYKDIVIIHPNPTTLLNDVGILRSKLLEKCINSHIAGEEDADIFYKDESIAISGIYRAKGNEVPMVYIINAELTNSGEIMERGLRRRRNILFTAMTRSKAWVRVCGIGERMEGLIEEYNQIANNYFKLRFKYPSSEEIKRLNTIYRDIDRKEVNTKKGELQTLEKVLLIAQKIKNGEAFLEDYPEEYRELIKRIIE